MKKDSIINIRVEDSLRNALEDKAKAEGMTFSDFIRWILRKATKD